MASSGGIASAPLGEKVTAHLLAARREARPGAPARNMSFAPCRHRLLATTASGVPDPTPFYGVPL